MVTSFLKVSRPKYRGFQAAALAVVLAVTAHTRAVNNDISGAAWMSGSTARNQFGAYEQKGQPHADNMPGARQKSVSWIDDNNNLWLFGGWGYATSLTGRLNDLWKYDPSTGLWNWVAGSATRAQPGTYGAKAAPHPDNVPGARQASVSWMDSAENLWLFGGEGYDCSSTVGNLNDLWKFVPETGNWTWVAGANTVYQYGTYGTIAVANPDNVPGARQGALSWTDDSGDLWLFGGYGYAAGGAAGSMSDLWRFQPSTGFWTWMAGPNTVNQPGVYGQIGEPDPNNSPGARKASAAWVDSAGDFWLFGGSGYDQMGSSGYLNDLWKFAPSTSLWTWVSGSQFANSIGIYGNKTVPDPLNVPSSRKGALPWIDATDKLWLFGGYGYDSTFNTGTLNDLWKFEPSTGQWTWLWGDDTRNQTGAYGNLGEPGLFCGPGARDGAVGWIDSKAKLWLFGGIGYAAAGYGQLNDLWRFDRFCKRVSVADLNGDCRVDFVDIAVIGDHWLEDNNW
ncbi:MAG: Kelch repeat-containing protein [Planctomycetota bacterium]|jgi:N-acetylneuraminic acid mutarotase